MNRRHLILIIFGFLFLWLICTFAATYQYQVTEQQSKYIHHLDKQLKSFQRILASPAPIRKLQIEQLESAVLAIHATRISLAESAHQGLIDTDLTQLLYLIERFTDRGESFVGAQANIRALILRLDEAKNTSLLSGEVQTLYHELGAFLLRAFYSEQTANPVNYLVLESLLLRSNELPEPNGRELRQILSQASSVLAEYAQLQYLSTELSHHRVGKEISKIEHFQYDIKKGLFFFVIAMSAITLLSVAVVTIWLVPVSARSRLATPDKRAVCAAQTTPIQASTNNDAPSYQESDLLPAQHDGQPDPLAAEHTNQADDSQPPSFDIEFMLETFEQDLESVTMILNVFLSDHRDDVEKIRHQFADDPLGALRTAHSLKGVAGNLGARSLKQAAQELEQGLSDAAELPQVLLLKLEKELSVVTGEIESYLNDQI